MITIAEVLSADHVLLNLEAPNADEAVARTVDLLRNDPRILDPQELATHLKAHAPCRMGEPHSFAVCLPHARSSAVREMVMSAARLAESAEAGALRYIFCLAVPQEMAADYLRIAGALMRLFTEKETEAALRTAANRTDFIEALSRLERRLV